MVALVAVSALMISCNNAAQQPISQQTASSVMSKIVYVNIDSLVNNYKMYIDLNGDFTQKADKIQLELERKTTAFQKKFQSYDTRIKNGLVTRTEALQMEQEMQKEQQDILVYRDEVLAELAEEEQVMINRIKFNIQEFIKKYNMVKKYDMILSHTAAAGTVMDANPELDITSDVIAGMNAEYVPEKK